jgi:uncharacterized protein involved in outer membrane biogenesis
MKKRLRWLLYSVALLTVLIAGVLTIAYWNRGVLLNKLTSELTKGINGELHVGKIDFTFLHHFPNFSITLHDVYLRDKHYAQYHQDIFTARKIFADVELYPLLKKEVKINSLSVNGADIFIFTAHNGDTNLDVLKKSSASTEGKDEDEGSIFLNLKEIVFQNVVVGFSDSIKNKFINFEFLKTTQHFFETDSGFTFRINGSIHFDSLHFNPKGGSYVNNKNLSVNLQVESNQLNRTLIVQPSTIAYEKNKIGLKGKFELRREGKYNLTFTSPDILPAAAQELLNVKLKKVLTKFIINDPVSIEVNLSGRAIQGYVPDVDVSFQTQQSSFRYGTLDFSALSLTGFFTNHVDSAKVKDNHNSKVTITSFKGIMEKIPVEGKVTFTKLEDPVMDLVFTSALSYKLLNNHLDNSRFIFKKGTFKSNISYAGKLSEYLDTTRTHYQGKLSGQIQATNATLVYKIKNILLDDIQLRCTFNENQFTIRKLSLNVNGSAVAVNGTMRNFIPFFIQPKNKGYVKLSVSSPNFDLTSLAAKRDLEKKTKLQNKQARKKMTDLLDKIYEKLEFDVDLSMTQLTFRKFKASHFKGTVRLNKNLLQANPISMQVAGGTMNLNFSLQQLFDPISPMVVDARLRNANIKELFLNFNNFNQKTIHADNLEGEISADVKFKAKVDETYTVLAPTMLGTLDCKITNGGLKNFEPMENMSNFLFKKRDFSDVQFAELNSNFSIAGTNMDISRMEIQSSVLTLFLEGRYSFTDSTSLSVQLPLSNLKKRHKDFKPKNIGTHIKAGPSVFLHVYRDKDINSKIKIDYDPFKKWAREE